MPSIATASETRLSCPPLSESMVWSRLAGEPDLLDDPVDVASAARR